MFLTSSILLGFIRLSFIILFLFYLNRKFINVSNSINLLDFIIHNWFLYGSILLVIIFILVQLNAYNLFNCFFILIPIIALDAIGIKNLKRFKVYFSTNIKASLLRFLKNSENKKKLWYWFSFKTLKKKNYDKNATLLLILTIILCAITFASRYYFIIYDTYSLSNPWIDDLNKVIQFDSQLWFANELSVNGEYALVNFYSKITDVSPEIALQVIAILESTLLAVIIFWAINKLSPSKFLAPLIASLSFSLVYIITPLNVYDLLKVNPTYAALTFGLPAFVFFLEPSLLKLTKTACFVTFSLIFTAIGLIDLFTFCILVPPFLIIGISLTKYKLDNLHILFSFVLAIAIVFGIYYSSSNYLKADFIEFIHANLLSVSSYTYLPQLILPYEKIIRYFQFSTFAGLLFIFPLVLTHKGNWRPTAIFFFYFNFLVLLTYINNPWIDSDMINNALVVIIPIIFGLNVAIIIRILNLVLYRYENWNVITISLILISSLFASVFYQKRNINRLTVSDETPKQILDAYDKIGKSFFPYSYCVVNDPAAQVISTNKHFFMNYSFFLEKYAKVDSINTKNKKDPKFLIRNPQFSLSKSVLVFVLNDKSKAENNMFSENKFLNASLIKELALLKKRGRKINLFYQNNVLKVYEIVNEPEESKISDLIF